MNEYIIRDNKKLKRGYTTGTCAAAATQAAVKVLLSHSESIPSQAEIMTPKGISVTVPVLEMERGENWACCGVKKDSGDDPDVTNGAMVYAKVALRSQSSGEILIDGGRGIGRVTKPGLACEVGQAAINPVPRKMILESAQSVCESFGYQGGLAVEISIPKGVELADKTFNPKLGIEGGISILGTSGIVEPMSEQALVDTIKVEISMRQAAGDKYLLITPGNYGETFLKRRMGLTEIPYVKCSNFIGDTVDALVEKDFHGILFIGHIGKLIKVAAGAMNTHSKYGDRRMNTLAEYAREAGADSTTVQSILQAITTEDGVAYLKTCGPDLEKTAMNKIISEIQKQLWQRANGALTVEVILYSNVHGFLGESTAAEDMLDKIAKQKEM